MKRTALIDLDKTRANFVIDTGNNGFIGECSLRLPLKPGFAE
jgi:hypothetical protein